MKALLPPPFHRRPPASNSRFEPLPLTENRVWRFNRQRPVGRWEEPHPFAACSEYATKYAFLATDLIKEMKPLSASALEAKLRADSMRTSPSGVLN